MSKNKFVLFAGGTGGHVFPAISFGNFLIKNGYNCTLLLDYRGLKYSNNFKGKIITISSRHFSGNIFYKIFSFFILIKGFMQSFYFLSKIRPNYCLAFGGYASFMPLTVSLIFKIFLSIKIYLHEQNSVLGKVNLFFLPFVNNIFLNFLDVKKLNKYYHYKTIHVGLPKTKDNFSSINEQNNINDKIKIFVYGGSQGSQNLNKGFFNLIKKLPNTYENKLSIVIQSSNDFSLGNYEIFERLKIKIESKPFFENIDFQLKSSNLVISRSGAGTIDDIITSKTPSILVPLPQAIDNHQYYNAKYLVDKKAAKIIIEKDLDTNDAFNLFIELLNDNNLRLEIVENLKLINSLDTCNLMIKKIINI
tara:strand:- start:1845 stop:2930 length:1086 start_codon:yes stop_codon:yes gene_type:complete